MKTVFFSRISRVYFLLLPILWLFVINGRGQQVISFAEFGGAVEKSVMINPANFNAEILLPVADKMLLDDRSHRVTKIDFVTRLFDIANFSTPRKGFHWPFEFWMQAFRAFTPPKEPYAELWKLRSGVGVALRDSSGRIDYKVIAGSNPFAVRWRDIDLKLIYLSIHQPGRGVKGRGPSPSVRVFVQSPRTLTSNEALRAAEAIKEKVGLDNIGVRFADSPWFTDDFYYPIYNRLASYPSLPPGEQYLKSVEWYCSIHCEQGLPMR